MRRDTPPASDSQPWQDLVPPLDVAFVWHLHRLQPSLYAADCQRLADAQGHVLHVELSQVRGVVLSFVVERSSPGDCRSSNVLLEIARGRSL
jgi:hypothetical protein